MANQQEFQNKIKQQFNENLNQYREFLNKYQDESEQLQEIRINLDKSLQEHQDLDKITLAFIGQYSSGKSTIISALTELKNIKIGAGVTTDQTTYYDWNDIKLIDTPGLWTSYKEHDEITETAIEKSDLLVFCITNELFDELTIAKFKEYAYDKHYQWKIILVINKMSREVGKYSEKKENYSQSLNKALSPHSLSEFPVCFIDAQDYCKGIEKNNENRKNSSNFDTFKKVVNNFIECRGSLARYDTPVRITIESLKQAKTNLEEQQNIIETLAKALKEESNRAEKEVEKEQAKLETVKDKIIQEQSAKIMEQGEMLLEALTNKPSSLQFSREQSNLKVRQYYAETQAKIKDASLKSFSSLNDNLNELEKNQLSQDIQKYIQANQNKIPSELKSFLNGLRPFFMIESAERLGSQIQKWASNEKTIEKQANAASKLEEAQKNYENCQKIYQEYQERPITDDANIASLDLTKVQLEKEVEKAQEEVKKAQEEVTASKSLFLSKEQVEGSKLHQLIENLDERITFFDLELGQHIEAAQIIGNFAEFFDELLMGFFIFNGLVKNVEEMNQENKKIENQRRIIELFNSIQKDLEIAINNQFKEVKEQIFVQKKNEINEKRKKQEEQLNKWNNKLNELNQIEQNLNQIIKEIEKVMETDLNVT